jgi:hypothetical protein
MTALGADATIRLVLLDGPPPAGPADAMIAGDCVTPGALAQGGGR